MNSRERVITSLNHREPDRVPIDFGGLHTSIHHIGHKRLLEYLKIPEDNTIILDRFQMVVFPHKQLLEKFHTDILPVFPDPGEGWELNIDPIEDSWQCEWGMTYKRPKDGFWYDPVGFPLKEGTIEELKKYKFPDPSDPNRVKGLEKRSRDLFENTDKAIILFQPTGSIFEHSTFLRGMENFYMDLVSNKKYVEELSERILVYMLKWWENILSVVKDYIHVVQVGGDLGSQNGPLFDPKIYRQIYKHRDKEIADFIHKKAPGLKIYMHSCGSIYEYIPDIIDNGIDIINPVQVSAKDMESNRLKKEFGKDIVFWGGGADATVAMTQYTPKMLKKEVKMRIRDFAPGGGFVFAPVHNIQYNVSPENVVTFFESGSIYGKYPIGI